MKNFRLHHLLEILRVYEESLMPLDLILRNYFRLHHAVGSKDRKEIAEAVYTLIRWQGLLDYLTKPDNSWKAKIEKLPTFSPEDYQDDSNIPEHIKVSFPKAFFTLLENSLGKEKALEFCRVSNETAPTTIRVNLLKTTRDAFLKELGARYSLSPCTETDTGVIFHKKENFFAMPEFKAGLFEIQDEGSQLLANLVEPKGKDLVLDFCAGSGGKTLAFAPKMLGRGQIYLHDIRKHVLLEAKKRLKRAGIQNAQILLPDSSKERLFGKMDWVLVDAPCSGTGTLRRNPDMKWKFTQETLDRLIVEQREIFKTALQFLSPKGKIVYATCSALPEENESQVAFFLKEHSLELTRPPLSLFPKSGGRDGFFGAVFNQLPC